MIASKTSKNLSEVQESLVRCSYNYQWVQKVKKGTPKIDNNQFL